jgi:hypothetical protein
MHSPCIHRFSLGKQSPSLAVAYYRVGGLSWTIYEEYLTMDHRLIGYIEDLSLLHSTSIFLLRRRQSYEMHSTLSDLQFTLIIMWWMYLSTSIIKWYHLIRPVRFLMYMDWRDINDEYQSLQFTFISQSERFMCHLDSRVEIADDRLGTIWFCLAE